MALALGVGISKEGVPKSDVLYFKQCNIERGSRC